MPTDTGTEIGTGTGIATETGTRTETGTDTGTAFQRDGATELGRVLLGQPARARSAAWTIGIADTARELAAYRVLRQEAFVHEQGLFTRTDRDGVDDDPRTVVLVARSGAGDVLGGVRLAPVGARDIGWWTGSRLVVSRAARTGSGGGGIGAALVRAAAAHAERLGVLRFDACVQRACTAMFTRLGWVPVRAMAVYGTPHTLMRRPLTRFETQAAGTKAALGALLAGLDGAGPGLGGLGGGGFIGDDGAPVPGTDLIAACDAIVPSLVERDPEWAGWCGVLVNLNDLAAMGAAPIGLLDAVAARDASFATRIMTGLRRAAEAWGVPVLGGHTQFGVPAALSVTALGRTTAPVPAGGGRPGQQLSLSADLGGGWRAGHTGRQWDSTSGRRRDELTAMGSLVARTAPAAAKDVSMAGLVGTVGMLAEASGCAAVLDIAAVPAPAAAATADWLSCFPGFAMITADEPGRPPAPAGPAVSAACGELVAGAGVSLRWPDGELLTAIAGPVTGLGPAGTSPTRAVRGAE